jgi:cysteine synthase B
MSELPTDDDKKPALLLRAVGNSPLLRLHLPGLPPSARLYAKLETSHPGGSLKDRPVARLLSNALEDGRLEGRRLLDAVGPAAAISYAVHAAALGLPLTLILPADIPRDLLERIAAHGAETILAEVSIGEGRDDVGPGAGVAEANRLQQDSPERYYFGDLAASEESWQAHYDTTGHEILAQVFEASGTVPEAFVAGVGSGATLMGVGRRLLRRRSDLAILAVEPAPGETLPGLQTLEGRQTRPAWFDFSLLAGRIEVRAEEARETCRLLAEQGLFVGPSSGANVFAAAALLTAERFRTVATVLCDGGERYLSRGWRLLRPAAGSET